MWLIYLLREIQQEFSMNRELIILTGIQTSVDFVIFFIMIVTPEANIAQSNNL
jgi:hypothetical protein